jgi:hypothetical protein
MISSDKKIMGIIGKIRPGMVKRKPRSEAGKDIRVKVSSQVSLNALTPFFTCVHNSIQCLFVFTGQTKKQHV